MYLVTGRGRRDRQRQPPGREAAPRRRTSRCGRWCVATTTGRTRFASSAHEVVIGDLTNPRDVANAMAGVERMFFNMSVSPDYLTATAIVCAVALEAAPLEVHREHVADDRLADDADQYRGVQPAPAALARRTRHELVRSAGRSTSDPTVFMENPLFTMLAARSSANAARWSCRSAAGAPRRSPPPMSPASSPPCCANPQSASAQVYELTGPKCSTSTGSPTQYCTRAGPADDRGGPAARRVDRSSARPRSGCPRTSHSTSPPWRGCTARAATTAATDDVAQITGAPRKQWSSTWPHTPTCLADRCGPRQHSTVSSTCPTAPSS